MKEDEKKKEQQVMRYAARAALVGVAIMAGYQIGKRRSMKIFNKHNRAGWSTLADRINEEGKTVGLMIPQEKGATKFISLAPASEEYSNMLSGLMDLYTI